MDIPLGEDQLIDLSAVSDIFHAMQEVTVGSFPLSDVVGGGDPQYVAQEIVRAIRAHGLLTSPRSIIDIGCGCGRIATALTQVLPAEAQYIGVDIVPALINFARERITPRFPHFRFVLLDESNAFYDYYRQAADAGHVSESTIRALDEAASRNSIGTWWRGLHYRLSGGRARAQNNQTGNDSIFIRPLISKWQVAGRPP